MVGCVYFWQDFMVGQHAYIYVSCHQFLSELFGDAKQRFLAVKKMTHRTYGIENVLAIFPDFWLKRLEWSRWQKEGRQTVTERQNEWIFQKLGQKLKSLHHYVYDSLY